MRRAVALAGRGAGRTNPNPLVGAVLVKDGRVVGEGWHDRFGGPHAERNALDDCLSRGEDPCGSTAYVTLEPCSHQGHQPPCADALARYGVRRVVVGSRDPNPLVSGRGVERLRAAGIEVAQDCLRRECDAINQVFFKYITTKTPYVVAKWAMTADGRIACASGDARWVTGERARADGHALRNRLAAIMVGAGTVLADDPALTCRVPGGRNPLRVVCDTNLSIPLGSQLVRTSGEAGLLVVCGALEGRVRDRAEALGGLGAEVVSLPGPDGRVDLPGLLALLGSRGVDSVLVEGGARLHASMFEQGLVDEVVAYVAPKLVGGFDAPGPLGGAGARSMGDAVQLGVPQIAVLGDDVRLAMRVLGKGSDPAGACVACGPLVPERHEKEVG